MCAEKFLIMSLIILCCPLAISINFRMTQELHSENIDMNFQMIFLWGFLFKLFGNVTHYGILTT